MQDMIKKNLLDLEYNTNLQNFNTCIILMFTYLIGIIIAAFTGQINYNESFKIILLFMLSIMFFLGSVSFMIYFRKNLKAIKKQIAELKF